MNYRSGLVRVIIVAALVVGAQPLLAFDVFSILPLTAPIPVDNPQTPAKIALGKQLFADKWLSVNRAVACNSCHTLSKGGADGRVRSLGALGKSTRRSTPSVLNAAFQSVQFWDGRAVSMEAAVKDHLMDPTVMGNPDLGSVTARITARKKYRQQFAAVFGMQQTGADDSIAQALAAYVRSLITPDSAFDRYLQGDTQALSAEAQHGFTEFQRVGCSACHFGINLSGPPVPMGEGFYELFPNYIGSEYDRKYSLVTDDLGHYEATREAIHKRLFRVSTLRNIALTAPYFHTGTVPTLDEAVRVMAKTQLEQDLSDEQVQAIVAFLKSLTGKLPQ